MDKDDIDAEYQKAKEKGEGRWTEVLVHFLPALGKIYLKTPRASFPCPFHDGEDDNCQFTSNFNESGLIFCYSLCGTIGIMKLIYKLTKTKYSDITAFLGGSNVSAGAVRHLSSKPKKVKKSQESEMEKRRTKHMQALRNSASYSQEMSLQGLIYRQISTGSELDPLVSYLHQRGLYQLPYIPEALKFHPGLPYKYQDKNGDYHTEGIHPCMLGEVTDVNGNLVTVHRTFLTADGRKVKLNFKHKPRGKPRAKTNMRCIFDGAMSKLGVSIKLHEVGEVICLTEGIEDGLTGHLLYGIPVHVAPSAHILSCVQVPQTVKLAVILRDNDAKFAMTEDGNLKVLNPGLDASRELRERLERMGIRVVEITPELPGYDINDMWNILGLRGFPDIPELAEFGYPTQAGVFHNVMPDWRLAA